MLPLEPQGAEAFLKATKVLRNALLKLVDAVPRDMNPTADSVAMEDLAKEQELLRVHPGWKDASLNLQTWGSFQVSITAESCASIAILLGSERAFTVQPLVGLRVAAEASGRAGWLYEKGTPSLERLTRAVNLELEDLGYRKTLPVEAAKTLSRRRARRLLDAAIAAGLPVLKKRHGVKAVGHWPPSDTAFARRGMHPDYAAAFSILGSSAVHGSMTALLALVREVVTNEFGNTKAKIGLHADLANQIILAAGASLMDAINAELEYVGQRSPEWETAEQDFVKKGTRYIQANLSA